MSQQRPEDRAVETGMQAKDIKVLIADDEIFFRQVLRDIINKIGFTIVAEAVDGNDAVQKFAQFRPHVTIMDIYMPEKNGIEATREMLAIDPKARVLVCSASDYDCDTEAALAVGAKAIVLKPFQPKELFESIVKVLGLKRKGS